MSIEIGYGNHIDKVGELIDLREQLVSLESKNVELQAQKLSLKKTLNVYMNRAGSPRVQASSYDENANPVESVKKNSIPQIDVAGNLDEQQRVLLKAIRKYQMKNSNLEYANMSLQKSIRVYMNRATQNNGVPSFTL